MINETVDVGGLRGTPRVTRTLAAAAEVARGWGHDYVGTEHVLLALMADEEGLAGRVLADLGATEPAREAILAIVRSPNYERASREAGPKPPE